MACFMRNLMNDRGWGAIDLLLLPQVFYALDFFKFMFLDYRYFLKWWLVNLLNLNIWIKTNSGETMHI